MERGTWTSRFHRLSFSDTDAAEALGLQEEEEEEEEDWSLPQPPAQVQSASVAVDDRTRRAQLPAPADDSPKIEIAKQKDAAKKLPAWLQPQPEQAQPQPEQAQQSHQVSTPSSPPAAARPLSPAQLFSCDGPRQSIPAPALNEMVEMFFLRECPAPDATVVQKVVSRLDNFPLLKFGLNGLAEMRSMLFSSDGAELLWKGKRGDFDVLPIRQLAGVSFEKLAEESNDESLAKLHSSRLNFTLQFAHRSVNLAARSEKERCLFLTGVLCLQDQVRGVCKGSDTWNAIVHQLLPTHESTNETPRLSNSRSSNKRSSVSLGQSLLLDAAESSHSQRVFKSIQSPQSAENADLSTSGNVVISMVMQKRIVCAASDDVLVDCHVYLLNDGTVVVSRITSANKAEHFVELARSSFFDVSISGVKSHVWMMQQPSPRLYVREGDDGTVHELQLSSEEAAEKWELAMQGTRNLLEQKLRIERDALARQVEQAQKEALLAARAAAEVLPTDSSDSVLTASSAFLFCQDRERKALQETEIDTIQFSDIMSKVGIIQQQLQNLDDVLPQKISQESILKTQLEQLKQKRRGSSELKQEQQIQLHSVKSESSFAAPLNPFALPNSNIPEFPLNLSARVSAVLDDLNRLASADGDHPPHNLHMLLPYISSSTMLQLEGAEQASGFYHPQSFTDIRALMEVVRLQNKELLLWDDVLHALQVLKDVADCVDNDAVAAQVADEAFIDLKRLRSYSHAIAN